MRAQASDPASTEDLGPEKRALLNWIRGAATASAEEMLRKASGPVQVELSSAPTEDSAARFWLQVQTGDENPVVVELHLDHAIVVSLQAAISVPVPSTRVNWTLLHSLRMVPVQFVRSTNLLYIALSEGVDHGVLAAIERMLRCQVVPCVVSDQTMDDWLSRESMQTSPRVQVFEKTSDAAEMARITASYAGRLSADYVQMEQCGDYAWVRLASQGKSTDLLFELHQSRQEPFLGFRETLITAV
ncbi:MAG TPA: hypothetical protein VLL05_17235 [Terriglobales bacterium]|nr:hypothetical protein [Terriglobales bacterium]